MQSQDKASAYLRSKVFSASPEELRLMLIDGAIRFARVGREGLAAQNWEQSYSGLSQAKSIVMELVVSLRPEIAPELCAKLSGLYLFMYRRLVDANLEKSPEIVDEVIRLLEYERETWVMLMERVAQDRANGVAEPAPAPAADATRQASTGAARSISVQG